MKHAGRKDPGRAIRTFFGRLATIDPFQTLINRTCSQGIIAIKNYLESAPSLVTRSKLLQKRLL